MTTKACLVTGGAGPGLGASLVHRLADCGWTVWAGDVDLGAARGVAEVYTGPGVVRALEMDVRDDAAVRRAVATVVDAHGGLDVVVNSAGVGLVKPIGDVSDEEFDRVIDVDLKGAWRVIRAALPHLQQRRGAIVNVGSVHVRGASGGYGVYAAAKAGLVALTRAVALDYGPTGVRCNVVHPGLIDSEQSRRLISQWAEPERWMSEFVTTRQMLHDPITGDDVAAAVVYLATAAAVTGTEVFVDAGTAAMLFDATD